MTVSVADHEHAYVGLADPGTHGTQPQWMPPEYRSETSVNKSDRTARLFVVRNALGEGPLRVTARNADDRRVTLRDAETRLVGASTGPEAVSGTVECPEGVHGPAPLELTVVVDSVDDAFHAEIDYPVTVVCAAAESTPPPTLTPEPGTPTPTHDPDADDESERMEDEGFLESPGNHD